MGLDFITNLYKSIKKRLFSESEDEQPEKQQDLEPEQEENCSSYEEDDLYRAKRRKIESKIVSSSNFLQKFKQNQQRQAILMEKPNISEKIHPQKYEKSAESHKNCLSESQYQEEYYSPGKYSHRRLSGTRTNSAILKKAQPQDSNLFTYSIKPTSATQKWESFKNEKYNTVFIPMITKESEQIPITQKLKIRRSFSFDNEDLKEKQIPKNQDIFSFSKQKSMDYDQDEKIYTQDDELVLRSKAKQTQIIQNIHKKSLMELQKHQKRIERLTDSLFSHFFDEFLSENVKNCTKLVAVPEIVCENLISEIVFDYLSKTRNFLPLSSKERDFVQDIYRRGNENDVVCNAFNVNITRKTLRCLSGLNWLNDEVINFYFKLLNERNSIDVQNQTKILKSQVIHPVDDQNLAKASKSLIPKCFFHNTFFLTKISKNLSGYVYDSVSRWTKSDNLFEMNKIFVPCHLGVHWTLAVINMRDKRFEYYDSMSGSQGHKILNILKNYIEDEYQDKIIKKLKEKEEKGEKIEKGYDKTFDTSKFKFYMPKYNEIPQQSNGSDCGVFCCTFAKFISQGFHPDLNLFSQDNMPYFRQRMLIDISTKKIL